MLTAKRENPSAVRSKNAMSKALLELMVYKPFGEISITDVTDRARLSRQTFYTNFKQKEDILTYMLRGLFLRCREKWEAHAPDPESLLVEYFLYWEDSRPFLSLLFRQDLGGLFQDCNRRFFVEDTDLLDHLFLCAPGQLPYIKAALAGVTYELMVMWITRDQGLGVDALGQITRNLMAGKLFG